MRLLLDPAAEGLVEHLLGPLEVEREMVGEGHLEERFSRPAVVADAGQEDPRAAVVFERDLVRVQSACRVPGHE